MKKNPTKYIYALRFSSITAIYDLIMKLFLRETTFKTELILQSNIKAESAVLDLGCGTGTLTLMIKEIFPTANTWGLDGDKKALSIAQSKAKKADANIIWDEGMSYKLPYEDQKFDRVLSSLLFHHLTHDQKARSLQEIFRVIKPGGELHIADWGKAENFAMRLAFLIVRVIDGFETTEDNANGRLPTLLKNAGFQNISITKTFNTITGSLSLIKCSKESV